MDDKRGEPEAAVFTTSYFLDDAGREGAARVLRLQRRPGLRVDLAASGRDGPKRVVIREDGTMPPPPYTVTDNPESWFEHFDLVFVDPPHTGYSITAREEARKKMLSVDGDVDALAECIRAWLGRHRRWGSPLYLAGESYGTTRGAALADKLQTGGVALSGLILVSCAMDLQSIVFAPAQRPAVRAVPAGLRLRRAVPRQAQGRARPIAGGGARGRRGSSSPRSTCARCTPGRGSRGRAAARRERVAQLTGLPAGARRREEPADQRPRRSSSSSCATADRSSAGSRPA